jgi:hypothetical protein
MLDGAYLNWPESALTLRVLGISLMLAGTGSFLRLSVVLWIRIYGARPAVALGPVLSIVFAA